ncbi:hypothetical protein [Amycolatopsis sp. BJA-103]|uniref:hypothetical protein n=1 Tax=Amycolatopsis sp. BJA-103 TaxID=1911175 RepID=UPI000C7726CD|nr:hypothetical protein [Amycolatopsis sp. BJA-103]AUI56786.1 hypothetical protein BKN51_00205 [Amycolatopsis sp. BJA-103]PNE13107.1 hypothetical protein B1H26_42345 [Amycolatopsis sp. BJA-103]
MTTSTRNPFETLLVGAFGLYSLVGLFLFQQVATSTIRGFPVPAGHVFLAGAALSCAVVLVGVWRAATAAGLLIERAGLLGMSGITVTYAVWGLGMSGLRGLAFCLLLGAMAAAGLWRVWQITSARTAARRSVQGVR